jgi:hypothetical protein
MNTQTKLIVAGWHLVNDIPCSKCSNPAVVLAVVQETTRYTPGEIEMINEHLSDEEKVSVGHCDYFEDELDLCSSCEKELKDKASSYQDKIAEVFVKVFSHQDEDKQ